jgi:ornithine decarboxylase
MSIHPSLAFSPPPTAPSSPKMSRCSSLDRSGYASSSSHNHDISSVSSSSLTSLDVQASSKFGSNLSHFWPENGDEPIYSGSVSDQLRKELTQINVDECAANGENAFFIADLAEVYRQHLRWMRELPRVVPFYAVKCNPDPYILRLLASLGTGFDCASNGEIQSVLQMGIHPDRIIYANPCKAASFVRNAAKQGVRLTTFDNLDELDKIKKFHSKAKLVVRILTDDSKSVCQLGLKFGAPMQVVPKLLQRARELDLDVVGVSFHVGSGCYDANSFRDAVQRARDAFDMASEAGYSLDFLDVGGGYAHENFELIAKVLRTALDDFFPDVDFAPGGRLCPGGLRIIGEPGRYYVQKAFVLAANIIARRDGTSDAETVQESIPSQISDAPLTSNDKPQVMYYQNDGVYGAFNCILFDHQIVQPKVLTLQRKFAYRPDLAAPGVEEQKLQACSVWGPTCDSIDCVRPMTYLPDQLQVSDWLVYENMGLQTSQVRYTIGAPGDDADMVRTLLEC